MRIAVIGDIHKHWDDGDVEYFNGSDYDAVLIVGDLPGRTNSGFARVTEALARLRKRTLVIPGNHDGVTVFQKLAELKQKPRWIERGNRGMAERIDRWREQLRPAELVGFSRHTLQARGRSLDIVAARPHSMGGPSLAFRPYLRERFGVDSFADSAARLRDLFDACEHPILVLAHNGPAGLGERPEDIWGCDFRTEGGDFGDSDLRDALDYARSRGKPVLGVVAGHMHRQLRGQPKRERRWLVERDGIIYANAAHSPRTLYEDGTRLRHHLGLDYDGAALHIRDAFVAC